MQKIITKKNLELAKKRLKPVKVKTISGKIIEIEICGRTNIAKVLEVSRQSIYSFEKTI